MPRSGELVRVAFEEIRHLGSTAVDAVVDAAHSVRFHTEDMPMVQATEYQLHRVGRGVDALADKLWDALSKH